MYYDIDMDKNFFKELTRKNSKVDKSIFDITKGKCGDDFESMIDYLKNHEMYFPDNIVTLGKGNINITLHNPIFNGISHYHNFFEIIYVYKGELNNEIYNDVVSLKENECIIQFPEIKHSVLRTSEDAIILNIIINKDFFNSSYYKIMFDSKCFFSIDKKNKNKYIICKNLKPLFKKLIDIFIEMFLSNDEYSQISFDNFLILLLTEMIEGNNNSNNDEFTIKLYTYINQNIDNISLKDASLYFGYHSKYFSSLVKSKTGKSFKEIIIEKKMEKAAYYLTYTNYSNSKVTKLIGYENNLSFYNNFQKIFGCSPNDFRKKQKKII